MIRERSSPRARPGDAPGFVRLRWLAVLLPTLAIGAFEFFRHEWLTHALPGWLAEGWPGSLLGALVVAGVVYGFVRVFSGLVRRSALETVEAREQTAVAIERQRIAREMHDGVAQTLFYLGANLREVGALVASGEDEEALGELRTAERHLKEAHERVRAAIADSLRGEGTEDLGEAVRRSTARTAGKLGLRVDCEIQAGLSVPAPCQRQILAIIDEALTNAHRHGEASGAVVRVGATGGTNGGPNGEPNGGLAVEVSDDGRGFDPGAEPNGESYGLTIMAERARMVNGDLRLASTPGQGSTVTVRIPGVEA